MSEHTPGPWTFRSVGSINEVMARWGDRDWLIAKLDSKSLGWHEDSYCAMLENDANARLIAAAPELLEAIKGLLKAVTNATVYEDGALAVMQAADAIAKAEGKS